MLNKKIIYPWYRIIKKYEGSVLSLLLSLICYIIYINVDGVKQQQLSEIFGIFYRMFILFIFPVILSLEITIDKEKRKSKSNKGT